MVGRVVTTRVVWLAALGLSGLLTLSTAHSAPPQTQPLGQTQHLDLSAPSNLIEQSANTGAFRSLASSRQPVVAEDQLRLPSLGSVGMRAQPTMQERVQQFHREGLPIARLWENHSSLVHVGLNQKGKPRLLLIQKLH
jgi:hypothetical protein